MRSGDRSGTVAELFDAHAEASVEELRAHGVVADVRRRSVAEARARWGDPLGILAAASGRVVEVELNRDEHPSALSLAYFAASPSTLSFHNRYVHPPEARVWRFFPLTVLLGAIRACTGREPIELEVTRTPSTFGEVRDLFAGDPPRRPLCIPPAGSGPHFVHGAWLDPYRMALHDLSHAIVLGERPLDRPRDAVRAYDAFEASLSDLPIPEAAGTRLDDLRDHLLSGYDALPAALAHVELRLRQATPMLAPVLPETVLDRMRAHLGAV